MYTHPAPRYLIQILVALLSLTAGFLHATELNDTLKESWVKHLENQLAGGGKKQHPKAWYAAMLLEEQPFNENALTVLVQEYERNGQERYAAVMALYAGHIGITNRFIIPEKYRQKLPGYYYSSESEVIKLGQLDAIDRALSEPPSSEEFVRKADAQAQLKRMLSTAGAYPEIIQKLGTLYAIQQRNVAAYALNYAWLTQTPGNKLMIKRQLNNLNKIDSDELTRLFVIEFAARDPVVDPNTLQAILHMAQRLELIPQAIKIAESWTKQDQQNGAAWQVLGEILHQAGKNELAQRVWTQAATLEGHSTNLYLDIARLCSEGDDVQGVIQWMQIYADATDEETLLRVLQLPEFRRHPRLLSDVRL